jgi:hypothetical protein
MHTAKQILPTFSPKGGNIRSPKHCALFRIPDNEQKSRNAVSVIVTYHHQIPLEGIMMPAVAPQQLIHWNNKYLIYPIW